MRDASVEAGRDDRAVSEVSCTRTPDAGVAPAQ